MIISASRRTDIPAFYSEWLMNRLREGYVLVRNPRNPKRSSRVLLNPAVVDCIVFWTKNPRPMLDKLAEIEARGYPFYFQITVTPYDRKIEKNLPPKMEIVAAFRQLSNIISPRRVIWRYDPIILNQELSLNYHLASFEKLAGLLGDYTEQCIFSFFDSYARNRKRTEGIEDQTANDANRNILAGGFARIATQHGISLSTCSETSDFSEFGITHAACIDKGLVESVIRCPIKAKKDTNQRAACGCIESVDIGCYDSCRHDCIYCYATSSCASERNKQRLYSPQSPLLMGELNSAGVITDRKGETLKIPLVSLFEGN